MDIQILIKLPFYIGLGSYTEKVAIWDKNLGIGPLSSYEMLLLCLLTIIIDNILYLYGLMTCVLCCL